MQAMSVRHAADPWTCRRTRHFALLSAVDDRKKKRTAVRLPQRNRAMLRTCHVKKLI